MRGLIFLSVMIGMIVGIFGTLFIIFKNIDAILHINSVNPDKDQYNFMILCPLDELPKKKYLIVEVKESKL